MMLPLAAGAEICVTQSQMAPPDRDALVRAAMELATKVQANDTAGLRAMTVPEYAKDFGGVAYVVANTAPKLKGGSLTVEQVYLLDASQLKRTADGTAPDAQFFCSLNKTIAETDFQFRRCLRGSTDSQWCGRKVRRSRGGSRS